MALGISIRTSDNVPASTGLVPGTAIPVLVQSSPNVTTDGNSNSSTAICVARSGFTALSLASTPRTTSGNSSDFNVGAFDQLLILITFTAASGTSPTVQFFLDSKDTLGNYYAVWTGSPITVITTPLIVPIGAGLTTNNVAFGITARLRWAITGTSPSWTFGGNVIGK